MSILQSVKFQSVSNFFNWIKNEMNFYRIMAAFIQRYNEKHFISRTRD